MCVARVTEASPAQCGGQCALGPYALPSRYRRYCQRPTRPPIEVTQFKAAAHNCVPVSNSHKLSGEDPRVNANRCILLVSNPTSLVSRLTYVGIAPSVLTERYVPDRDIPLRDYCMVSANRDGRSGSLPQCNMPRFRMNEPGLSRPCDSDRGPQGQNTSHFAIGLLPLSADVFVRRCLESGPIASGRPPTPVTGPSAVAQLSGLYRSVFRRSCCH